MTSAPETASLTGIVDAVLAHPGLRAKAEIGLVAEALGADATGGTVRATRS